MSEPLRGVVVAHGRLAAGLVSAVERITGVTDALSALSNEGLGAEELRAQLADACAPCPTVVFVDLAGGSCGMAGMGVRATLTDAAVVTGVNLPMLVDFVFQRELPLDQLIERMVEKGRTGITGHACDGSVASGPPPRS